MTKNSLNFLILESAQAGLSWLTILKKRENYREAYHNFDPALIANFREKEVGQLIENPGLIRNQRKIRASINNARRFIEIQEEFGSFCNYLWGFIDHKPIVNSWKKLEEVPSQTPLSEEISNDMRKRGFQFVGPTIIYAHLQATGLVNDHLTGCFRHQEIIDQYQKVFPLGK